MGIGSSDGIYLHEAQVSSLPLLCTPHPRSEALLKGNRDPAVRQNPLGVLRPHERFHSNDESSPYFEAKPAQA